MNEKLLAQAHDHMNKNKGPSTKAAPYIKGVPLKRVEILLLRSRLLLLFLPRGRMLLWRSPVKTPNLLTNRKRPELRSMLPFLKYGLLLLLTERESQFSWGIRP